VVVSENLERLNAEIEPRAKEESGGLELLRLLYRYPIIDARGVRKHLKMAPTTAIARLQRFEKLGIVREITGQKRGRVYRFDRYIDTLDDGWSTRKAAVERNRTSAPVTGNRA
jgi:DNA-binding MarR family transcriptional regulator